MNCKPGDLAVIVRGRALAAYIGQVVQCVSLFNEFLWRIDRSLDGDEHWVLVPDSCLKPLRDQPGADETLVGCAHGACCVDSDSA